jgi:hypothetical protein
MVLCVVSAEHVAVGRTEEGREPGNGNRLGKKLAFVSSVIIIVG